MLLSYSVLEVATIQVTCNRMGVGCGWKIKFITFVVLFTLGMSVCVVVERPVNFFHTLCALCVTLNLIFDFANAFVCMCF